MRTLVVMSALVLLALPGYARAGGYVSAGAGSDAALSGDMGDHFSAEDMSFQRLAAGHRSGPLALEVTLAGSDLLAASPMSQSSGTQDFSTLSLGLELKYYVGLGAGLEAYGRGGVDKTWLAPDVDSPMGYEGRGYTAGGGLQYAFRLLPLVKSALWVDYSRHVIDLGGTANDTLSGSADMLTLGLSVGTSL